jgi:HEPN domain-containing protein
VLIRNFVVVVAALNAEERIKVYLEDAKRFLGEALREFEEGVRSCDVTRIRDAAEKAWNSIV